MMETRIIPALTLWQPWACLVEIGADAVSQETIMKLPVTKDLRIEATAPRNPQFHRMVFALFGILAKAFDEDLETVRHKLMISIGEYDTISFPDGSADRRAKSLAYANMDDLQFKELFEKLVKATYLLYGILSTDMRREIDDLLAPKTVRS